MDKILSFLGMCKKAGALETGEESVGAVMRKGKAVLILTASDAAANTVKRANNYAEWGNTELAELPHTKDELGDMLGKRVCAVLAVTDLGMAVGLSEKLAAEHEKYRELHLRLDEKLKKIKGRKTSGSTNLSADKSRYNLSGKTQDKSDKGGM